MTAPVMPADPAAIARAAAVIAGGGLVAFPTETVYGLGADAGSDAAVARLFAAKDRPRFNPLIAHIADPEDASALVELSPEASALAAAFWPGPLTLVLPLRPRAPVSALVTCGAPTLALRCPAHPVARALIAAAGRPLAAPSAHPAGRGSPPPAAHVASGLGDRVDLILDGGPTEVGLESTILSLAGRPRLLRAGGLPTERLEAALGVPLDLGPDPERPEAPGQLASHYAPRGSLRLDAAAPEPGETMVGFGDVPGTHTLSASGDLTEAAARLFAIFHALDAEGATRIAVAPIPDAGLGRAINDRLRRAAAPRP